ncbi:hypothetical protein [Nocardia heshunensis]
MLLMINDGTELSTAEVRFVEWISWSPAQARTNALAVKNWIIGQTGRQCFVHSLAMVMLRPHQDVPSLRAPHTPNMIDIIVEDFDVFRYYLHRSAADPVVWTGEQVADVIDRLGLSHLYASRTILAVALGETPRPEAHFDLNAPF